MAERTFFQFLDAALEALRAEAPKAYALLLRALAPTGLLLCVDGETQVLAVVQGAHRLSTRGTAAASLRTARTALVELLEGRRTLLDAVLDESIEIRGTPERVAALHDALVAFFAGSVRSRSLPALLSSYLDAGESRQPVEPHGITATPVRT